MIAGRSKIGVKEVVRSVESVDSQRDTGIHPIYVAARAVDGT
jgi:hypothetical protein